MGSHGDRFHGTAKGTGSTAHMGSHGSGFRGTPENPPHGSLVFIMKPDDADYYPVLKAMHIRSGSS